jgi:tetratricopeptide (TPR) repeat protein
VKRSSSGSGVSGRASEDPRAQRWGGVARRGARNLESNPPVANKRMGGDDQDRGRPPSWSDSWQDEGPVRDEASRAVARGAGASRSSRPAKEVSGAVRDEVARAAGPDRADRSTTRLQDAAGAYSRERYQDARRIIAPLAEQLPGSPAVRELHGLTLYRMGKWKDAIKELDAFQQLTGSVDQLPVVADCHRALGQMAEVERRWDELRRAGADVAILTEARIVLAGATADRGDVVGGIKVLLEGPVDVRKPQEHHLRLWYALAGLYERAGDVPRARELFSRIVANDPTFADAAERLDALS